jgi:hypothetical protein
LGKASRGIELERELQPVGIVFATHETVVGFIAAQGCLLCSFPRHRSFEQWRERI